jgi:hypothetical protein
MREGALEAILGCVLGILRIPRDTQGHAANTRGMSPDKFTESGWMSHPSCGQKHGLLCAWANVSA